jgi:phosphate transport system permease protein
MASTIGTWPYIGPFFDNTENYGVGFNIFSAGVVLAIMVTPIMTAIIRDVLLVAPPELEQGALGLGATWWQATRLVLGYSKMGIFGAIILGFARAVGETMAVTMVVGNGHQIATSLFSGGFSIASKLANQFRNSDTEGEVQALIYAAFVLLIITLLINSIARLMVMRLATRAKRR